MDDLHPKLKFRTTPNSQSPIPLSTTKNRRSLDNLLTNLLTPKRVKKARDNKPKVLHFETVNGCMTIFFYSILNQNIFIISK